MSVNKVDILQLPKFTMPDLQNNVSGSLSENDLMKFLLLLNKYRDCFEQRINDLSEIKNSELSIQLTDDKSV